MSLVSTINLSVEGITTTANITNIGVYETIYQSGPIVTLYLVTRGTNNINAANITDNLNLSNNNLLFNILVSDTNGFTSLDDITVNSSTNLVYISNNTSIISLRWILYNIKLTYLYS